MMNIVYDVNQPCSLPEVWLSFASCWPWHASPVCCPPHTSAELWKLFISVCRGHGSFPCNSSEKKVKKLGGLGLLTDWRLKATIFHCFSPIVGLKLLLG